MNRRRSALLKSCVRFRQRSNCEMRILELFCSVACLKGIKYSFRKIQISWSEFQFISFISFISDHSLSFYIFFYFLSSIIALQKSLYIHENWESRYHEMHRSLQPLDRDFLPCFSSIADNSLISKDAQSFSLFQDEILFSLHRPHFTYKFSFWQFLTKPIWLQGMIPWAKLLSRLACFFETCTTVEIWSIWIKQSSACLIDQHECGIVSPKSALTSIC